MKQLFTILSLLFCLVLKADYYRGLQINFMPGFLIAHREYMANMEAHTFGIEAIYSSDMSGWKQVDTRYKHLKWGTGFSYYNLGNRQLNGNVYALHFNVEANLKKRKHFQSAIRFGSGVGYLDRPYDLKTNKMNKAIGSNLNGNMQLMYKTYFDVSPKNSLVLGLGVTHYSNGNFRRPNLGINMVHFNCGLLYKIKIEQNPNLIDLPKLFPDRGFEWTVGYARKQIAVADTRFFTILSSGLLYYFKHNETRNWRFGTQVYFDKTYPYTLFNENSLRHVKLAKMTEIALVAGHEFVFGRLAIVTDIGTYVYRPNDYKKAVYFSIGFNYFFNRGFTAQTRLKSHMAVADFFYWSGGYRFSDNFLRKK
ncbi:MAG TPA: acyloxyacyl hydrolase [Bacteroidia bacterium]